MLIDRHRITGEGDDTFDPKFTAIIWTCKQNEIAALRVGITVGIFYSNETVARKKGGDMDAPGPRPTNSALLAEM